MTAISRGPAGDLGPDGNKTFPSRGGFSYHGTGWIESPPKTQMKTASKLSIVGPALSLLALALCPGCGRGDASTGAAGTALGKLAQAPVPVAIEPARRGPIASYYRTTATLEVEKRAEVVARVAGVVIEILVEEGDLVDTGDPLLRIDNVEYLHVLRQAEASTKNLGAKFQRLEEMLAQNLVSVEEYDTARNEYEVARATEALARLDVDYTTVRAPFAGRITLRHADVGQKVSLDTSLFTIADFDPLLARVHVPAKEFKKIQADQAVELVLDSTGERLEGRIKLVSPIIDPSTGTIKVTIEVHEYPPETRPGDFAEVNIVTERREESTLVVKNAVISDKGERIVYVAIEDDRAERRVVEVGFTDDMHAEILTGVQAGERVVIKGQRSLKHGAPLKVLSDAPITLPSATSQSS